MIGQNKLKLFVESLAKKETIPIEINILLTGNAGIGKSHAIRYIASQLSNQPDYSDCIEHHPKYTDIALLKRFDDVPLHIIDEVHKLERFEQFYSFMETHLLISATNLPEDLPEAFRSRCINLVLENYTNLELGRIVEVNYDFSPEVIDNLIRRSRGTPRDILQMASIIHIDPTVDLETLGYFMNGFRREDMIYLEYLSKVGTSSLGRIAASTNLDSTLITEYVEPFLLERQLITITNRRQIASGINIQSLNT